MHDSPPARFSVRTIIYPLLFAVVILAAGGWLLVSRLSEVPVAIIVNGRTVVNVESMQAAEQVLDEVRHDKAGKTPANSICFEQNVTLRPVGKNVDVSPVPEAERKLETLVTVDAELYAISLDDKPLIALADRHDAEDVLDLVKSYYENKLPNKSVQSKFKGNVSIVKRYVNVDKFCATPEDAVQELTSMASSPVTYVMRLGDTASSVAIKYGVSVNSLRKANPGKNLNRLIEGDLITVKPAEPAITVISKAYVNKTEDVDPPYLGRRHRQLKSGKRQVEALVTYENGQQTREEIISQITTWDRPKRRYTDDTSVRPRRHYRRHWTHADQPSTTSNGM